MLNFTYLLTPTFYLGFNVDSSFLVLVSFTKATRKQINFVKDTVSKLQEQLLAILPNIIIIIIIIFTLLRNILIIKRVEAFLWREKL